MLLEQKTPAGIRQEFFYAFHYRFVFSKCQALFLFGDVLDMFRHTHEDLPRQFLKSN